MLSWIERCTTQSSVNSYSEKSLSCNFCIHGGSWRCSITSGEVPTLKRQITSCLLGSRQAYGRCCLHIIHLSFNHCCSSPLTRAENKHPRFQSFFRCGQGIFKKRKKNFDTVRLLFVCRELRDKLVCVY